MFKKLLVAAAFFASFSIQANACIITGTVNGGEPVFIDLKLIPAISIADGNSIRVFLYDRTIVIKVDSAPMVVSVFARCKEAK